MRTSLGAARAAQWQRPGARSFLGASQRHDGAVCGAAHPALVRPCLVMRALGERQDSQPVTPRGLPGSGLTKPPRRTTSDNLDRRNSSGGGGGDGGGDGDGGNNNRQRRRPEDTVVGLGIFAGLLGSAATLLGSLLGVDPFGAAHFDPRDMALGLALAAPLMALDILILVPEHRDGETGVLDRLEGAAVARLGELEAKLAARREAAGGVDTGDAAAAVAARLGGGASTSSSSRVSSSNGSAREVGGSSGASGNGSSGAADSKEPSAGLWGPNTRNGLFLAQGQLSSLNPAATAGLPLPVEGAITAAECLASEMLWRAVLLQALGGWVTDRMFEAGMDDTMHIGPYLLGTSAAGTCLAAALVVTLSAASAAQRVSRTGSSSFAGELRNMAEQVKRKRAVEEQKRRLNGDGSNSNGPGSSSSGTPESRGASSSESSSSGSSSGGRPPGVPRPDPLNSPGWVSGSLIPQTLGAMQSGESLLAARTVLTTTALSLAFAATGNLAASLAGSLASAAVFSLCSRYRQGKFRQERVEADRRMASLRAIADRYKAEKAALEALEADQPEGGADKKGQPPADEAEAGGTLALLDSLLGELPDRR